MKKYLGILIVAFIGLFWAITNVNAASNKTFVTCRYYAENIQIEQASIPKYIDKLEGVVYLYRRENVFMFDQDQDNSHSSVNESVHLEWNGESRNHKLKESDVKKYTEPYKSPEDVVNFICPDSINVSICNEITMRLYVREIQPNKVVTFGKNNPEDKPYNGNCVVYNVPLRYARNIAAGYIYEYDASGNLVKETHSDPQQFLEGPETKPVDVPQDIICPFCLETIGVWRFGGYIMATLKLLIPLLLIVFASIDLGKAVMSEDEKDIKSAGKKVVSRLIIGILIFFTPTIIKLFFGYIEEYQEIESKGAACINCLLDARSDECTTAVQSRATCQSEY